MNISKILSVAQDAAVPLTGVTKITPAADMTFSLRRKCKGDGAAWVAPGDAFVVNGTPLISVATERDMYNAQCLGSFPTTGALVRANVVCLDRGKGYAVNDTFHLINNGVTGVTSPHDEVVTVTEVYPDGGIKQFTLGGQGSTYTLGRATAASDVLTGPRPAVFQINQVGTWSAAVVNNIDVHINDILASETYKVFVGQPGAWTEYLLTNDFTVVGGTITFNGTIQPIPIAKQWIKVVAYSAGTKAFVFTAAQVGATPTADPRSTSTGAKSIEVNDGVAGAWVAKTVTTAYVLSGTGDLTCTFVDASIPAAGLQVRMCHTFALGDKITPEIGLDANCSSAEVFKVTVDGVLKTVTTHYTVEAGPFIKFAAANSPAVGQLVHVYVQTGAMVCVQGDEIVFDNGVAGGYSYQVLVPTAAHVLAVSYE